MVEGTVARVGAAGARTERESEKEAKGRRLGSSRGWAPAPASESGAAAMVGEMRG
uniref:Uncharacterized protein n=1 Tax=Arundo donax TaxID=35708 RepID=A0A0A9GIB1_ARUDO